MLVYDQILDRVDNYTKYKNVYKEDNVKPLIEDFKLSKLQSVSYDVTMGNKIRKFKDEFKTVYLDDKNSVDNLFEEIDITYGYQLRPDEFILVTLNERLNMPDDLAAHLRPRTTFNKLGLLVTSQHVNPSYTGNLQIGIKNSTPNVVVIKPNLTIGQLIFESVDEKIRESELYRNKSDSKYQGENDFVGSKIYNEKDIEEARKIFNDIMKEYY